jgi:hypothetical protein
LHVELIAKMTGLTPLINVMGKFRCYEEKWATPLSFVNSCMSRNSGESAHEESISLAIVIPAATKALDMK